MALTDGVGNTQLMELSRIVSQLKAQLLARWGCRWQCTGLFHYYLALFVFLLDC